MDCRYLDDPPQPGDPMRRDTRLTPHHGCPRCGGTSWLDLRNRDTASKIDEIDGYERQARATGLNRGILGALFLLLFVMASVWLGMVVLQSHGAASVLFTTFALGLALVPIVTGPSLSKGPARRTTPARWRMVAPVRPRGRGASHEGAWRPEQHLRAPLTGRPCAAYEIGVRLDADADAKPSTWALLEQRGSGGRLGSVTLAPDACYLVVERRALDPRHIVLSREQRDRFLRARGLDPGGEHTLFESIIPVGAPCRHFAGDSEHAPVVELL
ncbi:MAG: hypothetical protein K0V04_37230 [Deltaproteobacteria bacterium]|nr:hypothetical protein [Deltaproteobacteria bacterium]